MVVFSFNYWVNFFLQRIFHISFSHSLRKWSVIYIQNNSTMIKINMYFLIAKLRWFNFKSYTELYFPHIPNCCKNFLAIGSGRPLLLWINLDKSPPLQYSIMRKMYWSFHWWKKKNTQIWNVKNWSLSRLYKLMLVVIEWKNGRDPCNLILTIEK